MCTMQLFELTRALIDTESITGNEERIGLQLLDYVSALATRYGGRAERIRSRAAPRQHLRLLGRRGPPSRSPPTWIPCRRSSLRARTPSSSGDAARAIPRASSPPCSRPPRRCSNAAHAISESSSSWARNATASVAYHAAAHPQGARYLINGEPTENKLALGSKGALRYEIAATGRMAHSAYPELGESAIDKLLDALARIRAIPLPVDDLLGPSTLNIGTHQPAGARPTSSPTRPRPKSSSAWSATRPPSRTPSPPP